MRRSKNGSDCDPIYYDVIQRVSAKIPNLEKTYCIADFFGILGDRTRIRILLALDQSEMCVCDLAVLLDSTKSAISHQLRGLKQSKLVISRKEGKHSFYSLADDHIRQIIELAVEHLEEEN